MSIKGLFTICLLFFMTGCDQMGDKPKDGFAINGKVERTEKGQFIRLYKVTPTDNQLVDSVEASEDGSFRFVGKVDGLQMFRLAIYTQQPEFFVAGNEDVTVEVKGVGINRKVEIIAGEEQKLLEPVMATFRKQNQEFQPMAYEYEIAVQNRDMPRAENYRQMLERGSAFYKRRYKTLIDSLGPSFAAYTAASQLSLEDDFGALDTLAQKLTAKYKGQKWVEVFNKQLADVRALAVGQTAPAFSLATPTGKLMGPADFKGKYLVLDFWASWCKPCRINSPAMVKLYKKYKDQNVEILGVSLDQNADKWKEAIKDDSYTWPQVSDLKMWDSEAAKLYKVESIPTLVLLDKEGKIVARNLTPETLDILLAGMVSGIYAN